MNSETGLAEPELCQHHAKLPLGFTEDFPVFAIARFSIFMGGAPIGSDEIGDPVAILATDKRLNLLNQYFVDFHRLASVA